MITEYFSKWRKEWIPFTDVITGKPRTPNEAEIKELKKYHYKLR